MTSPNSAAPSSSSAPARPVDALADRFVKEYAALDPVHATTVGVAGHDDVLTDLSPDGFAARADLVSRTLAEVRDATPVDDREQAAKDAFVERLQLVSERAEAGVTRSEMSVIESGLHDLRMCFDLMDTSTEEGWRNVDQRLALVEDTLNGYRRTLLDAAEEGHVSSRRQYAQVALQIQGWTGGDGGIGLFERLVTGAPEGPVKTDLEHHAVEATRAVADFGRFLEELHVRGREDDAVGRDHYGLASRYFLGIEVDLDETYRWGWAELERIHSEIYAVCDEIRSGAGPEEAAALLNDDPSRQLEGTDALQHWMQELSDRTVADLGGTHFDIPEPVRRLECRIAPTHDGGIYYTGPSEDFTRPGRMWWSVPNDVTHFTTWEQVSTVHHEGVPGHHLQVGQTVARTEQLNRWQRLMCWVSGTGEGWALYAERLMVELGYLDDPGDRLGMLFEQAFRARRVVVDIGLHCRLPIPSDNFVGFHPGEHWSPALMVEFMSTWTRMDPTTVHFEVNRYLGWPGQAPSYKVGERLWLQARADAAARHGADFDLKTFHRQALDLGAVGLDPLVTSLARL